MVRIYFEKLYLKPHTEHKIDVIDYNKKKMIKQLEKRGFSIIKVETL